ncbi:hypothetical protein V0R37_15180 [Pollutimonas sp. H1-120]|uniref:hypothetical protein n=1 Tax=Pollutimonas sp. H1-120 TaxID=3148824 RepID=UPI003B51C4DA
MTYDPMQKHEQFIMDMLLPAIVDHARNIGVNTDEAALAAFLSLGTVLQSTGLSTDDLMAAVKASAPTTHDAPEALQ